MQNQPDEKKRFLRINEAICFWLGYQFKIGRKLLIHEASLRYPLADAITSGNIGIGQVVLEYLHPIFKSKKIDLVVFDEKSKVGKDGSFLKEAFEFKLAKEGTGKEGKVEHQRVFNDLLRLAFHSQWQGKKCYFLMAGTYEDFKVYFVGQKNAVDIVDGKNQIAPRRRTSGDPENEKWSPEGLYKDWFGFSVNEEKRMVFKDDLDWGLSAFKKDYQVRKEVGKIIPSTVQIKTKCLAITPSGLGKSRTHASGIWEVSLEE